MEDMYINAVLITIIFFAIKMIEGKVNKDETIEKPLKHIVKDCAIVFICSVIGTIIYTQFFPMNEVTGGASAFTNSPDF